MKTLHYSLAVVAMLLPALVAAGQNTIPGTEPGNGPGTSNGPETIVATGTMAATGAGTETGAETAVDPERRMAVVEFSADFMREKPDYAAELGNQALMGTVVEIVGREGYWVKIKSPDPYTAWVTDLGLVEMTGEEAEDYLAAPKYICTAAATHIFEEPSLNSRIVSEFILGDIVRVMFESKTHAEKKAKEADGSRSVSRKYSADRESMTSEEGRSVSRKYSADRESMTSKEGRSVSRKHSTDGKSMVSEDGRPVIKKHFAGVILPSGKTGYVPVKDVVRLESWASDRESRLKDEAAFRQDLVSTALGFLGVPYLWGGTSIKNVDCSGLSRSVYFANGLLLPRNASQQAVAGCDRNIFNDSGDVDWSELLPGDLIFWGKAATDSTKARATHVGMYIGKGRFIHSAQVVRINSLDPSAPDYYDRKPIGARNMVGSVDSPDSGVVFIGSSPFYFPAHD
jgi:cell wall-associated NlpC family hydrolase